MRSNGVLRSAISLAALSVCAASASAGVVWDESVNGDLSGDRLNPTNLVLHAGTSSLTATSQSGDREYVHFSLPAGTSLVAINHISWISLDDTGFIGVQSGSTFTEPPTGTNVANLLGYSHFGSFTTGGDILPSIGLGAGAVGFTPPLTGSNYTFWIQQTSSVSPSTYQLDFVVVPSPGVLGVLGALMWLAPNRRPGRAPASE